MSNLTNLAAEVSTQLQALVASGHLINLTNQTGTSGTLDSTLLLTVANHASRRVRGFLGDIADDDDLGVDFAVRLALLRLQVVYSLTLTDAGAAFVAGVYEEMREEQKARRQSQSGIELAEEDFMDLDDRYPEKVWDQSV